MKKRHIINILLQLGTIISINIVFSHAPKIAFASLSVLVFFNYTIHTGLHILVEEIIKTYRNK